MVWQTGITKGRVEEGMDNVEDRSSHTTEVELGWGDLILSLGVGGLQ